jgi:CRP-like cAMP-binding protein
MSVENYLLAAMPRELYDKLAPNLKRVSLQRGDMLHYPGDTIEDLYFPIDCALSITMTMNDGRTAETGIVGKREAIGVNAFMGGSETTQTTYIVQVAGTAFKIDARPMLEEFNCNKDLRDVLLPYTQALIAQISQTTACNRLHTLEQRLARWLLEVQDRVESNELRLTQEFIADMLGVRRAGVTQAAQKLQDSGLIRYTRGHVDILDLQRTRSGCVRVFQSCQRRIRSLAWRKAQRRSIKSFSPFVV